MIIPAGIPTDIVVEEEEEYLVVEVSPSPSESTMDFVEIATTGNATDFGDLTSKK